MRFWALIPTGFGLWWLSAGLSAIHQLSERTMIALCLGAMIVAAIGLAKGRNVDGRSFDHRPFKYAFIGEAIGISLVMAFCVLWRLPSLIIPLIGIVVGLHFIPLSKAFDDRRFIVAGSAMALLSLGALLWSAPERDAVAGIGGGAILWLFALWASLAAPRHRRRQFRG